MAAVLAGRRFRLTIGGNDWSNWCTEAALQCEELDLGDGLIRSSATFTLDVSERIADATYRLNPTQWAKGTAVLFEIENDSQIMTVPNVPTGQLFILKEPSAPSVTNPFLTLDCGCVLALKDFQEPDQDVSGVDVGTPLNRETITANILTSAGVSSSLTAIGDPVDYPIPKRSGSFVQLAGNVAIASKNFLYVDSTGNVKNKLVDIEPSSAALSITVGQNEAFWEPSEDTETPAEKLCVSGVAYSVDTLPFQEYITTKNGIITTNGNQELFDPYSRTTLRIYAYDSATKSQTTETIEETIKAGIWVGMPRLIEGYDELTTSEIRTDTKFYDGEKLIREVCTIDKAKWLAQTTRFAADETKFEIVRFSEYVTNYFYSDDGTISRITVEGKKVRGRVGFSGVLNQLNIVPSEKFNSTWDFRGGETWTFTEQQYIPRFVATGFRVAVGSNDPELELVALPATTVTSNDGSTNPPATEYLSENRIDETAIKACVSTQGLATVAVGDLTKEITLDHAVDSDQLYEFGQIYSAFLWGRRYGWRVGLPISDTVFTLSPLDRCDVTDGTTIYRLLIDGLSYVLNSTEAYAFFAGIEVGTAPTASPSTITNLFDYVLTGIATASATTTITASGSITGNVGSVTISPLISGSGSDFLSGDGLASATATVAASGQTTGNIGNIEVIIVVTGTGKVI